MAKIRFEVIFDTADIIGQHIYPVEGKPVYILRDWSFYYDMKACYVPTVDLAVLTSGTIQLSINVDTWVCVFVDGYHHWGLWELVSLSVPHWTPGVLKVHIAEELAKYFFPGCGYSMEDMVPPKSWFDPTTGWWCIGTKEQPEGSVAIEFAQGCGAVVKDELLVSLWLKIDNWREVAAVVVEALKPKRRWWQFWRKS